MRSDPTPRPPLLRPDGRAVPRRRGQQRRARPRLRDDPRAAARRAAGHRGRHRDACRAADRDRLHPVSAFVWGTDRRDDERVPGQARRTAHRHGPVVHRLRGRRPPGHDAAARRGAGPGAGERLRPLPRLRHAGRRRRPRPHGWASRSPTSTYAVDGPARPGRVLRALADALHGGDGRALPGADGATASSAASQRRHATLVARASSPSGRRGGSSTRSRSAPSPPPRPSRSPRACPSSRGLWEPHGRSRGLRDGAVEEAIRIGNPFPQASRFVREPFADRRRRRAARRPGADVAHRGQPRPARPARAAARPVRPGARQRQHLGFGSGYHLCGGVHHVREVAVAAVTTLAERCPQLRHRRAVEAVRRHRRRLRAPHRGDRGAVNRPIGLRAPQLGCRSCRRRLPAAVAVARRFVDGAIGFRVRPIGSRCAAHGDELAPLSSLDRRRGDATMGVERQGAPGEVVARPARHRAVGVRAQRRRPHPGGRAHLDTRHVLRGVRRRLRRPGRHRVRLGGHVPSGSGLWATISAIAVGTIVGPDPARAADPHRVEDGHEQRHVLGRDVRCARTAHRQRHRAADLPVLGGAHRVDQRIRRCGGRGQAVRAARQRRHGGRGLRAGRGRVGGGGDLGFPLAGALHDDHLRRSAAC